jgi:hypothetical protein
MMMIISYAIKNGLMINHVITFINYFRLAKNECRKSHRLLWSNDFDIHRLLLIICISKNIEVGWWFISQTYIIFITAYELISNYVDLFHSYKPSYLAIEPFTLLNA